MAAIERAHHRLGGELIQLQPAASNQELYAISPPELVDQVLAHDLDALICTGLSAPVVQALLEEDLALIHLAETRYDHPRYTGMRELFEGGQIAGRFIGEALLGKGHAVCITAELETMPVRGQSRLAGFRDALKAFPGITMGHIPAYWSYDNAYPVVRTAFLHYPHPIDALFGVSDTILLAARDAGRELGVLHEKTLLVGLNGDPLVLAEVAEGKITATVDIASEFLGEMAYEAAHKAALGDPQPQELGQDFQLITLENVASIATRKLTAIAGIPSQMVGQNRLQEQDRLTQLEISTQITRQIGSILDRKRLFEAIHSLVQQYFGYEWMQILRWSESEARLTFYEGSVSPVASQISADQDQLPLQVFQSNEVCFIPDTRTSHRWPDGKNWVGVRARAVLPIHLGSQVIGVLDLQSSHPVLERSLETIGLELLANQIGIAIQNADLYLEAIQARAAAERANQLKTRLVANVGHEMRTPLNAILGFSQGIEKKIAAGTALSMEQLSQDIHYIYTSGEHLMYMINDLLDLSRAEIGALQLYFEPLQPTPFLKDLFEAISHSVKLSPGVRWQAQIAENLPLIRADTVRLRQILINLVANAAKFTLQGSITLGAELELPYLHVWVQDTGPGVPIEVQEKIFEPFNTTRKKQRSEGIGLGLSITRHLVSLHEGTITLESQPGAGSIFHVYLPLPGAQQSVTLPPDAECQPVMLVVSSQPSIPPHIQQICDQKGLQAYPVNGKDDLNQVLAQGLPAAIAWDLAHTTSLEWSLVTRLSGKPKCSALPVILFGAAPGQKEGLGLTNIIFKPWDGNTLQDWLSRLDGYTENGSSILIVDDDDVARNYYTKIIQALYPGKRVVTASDGRQALDFLTRQVPSLILLDLMMPEVDGFAVLEQVRSQPQTRQVPVVVISGKLLTYEDIQRLNHLRTGLLTKEILTAEEAARLLERVGEGALPLSQPTSLLVRQGLAFMHQSYAQPINRKEIAAAVGVTENYFSQIFHQEITLSPWDYLTRLRIQRAKELLISSTETITRIATQVGFNDSGYFSRVFRKQMGVSPMEFRQAHRQDKTT